MIWQHGVSRTSLWGSWYKKQWLGVVNPQDIKLINGIALEIYQYTKKCGKTLHQFCECLELFAQNKKTEQHLIVKFMSPCRKTGPLGRIYMKWSLSLKSGWYSIVWTLEGSGFSVIIKSMKNFMNITKTTSFNLINWSKRLINRHLD